MTTLDSSSSGRNVNDGFSNRNAGHATGIAVTGQTADKASDQAGAVQASVLIESKRAQAAQLDAIRKSVAFTQIVSLMMRSPLHGRHTLADLEWLFLPALRNDQFKIAEAKSGSINVPAGFVLWASVSRDVDKRLTESLDAPARLGPEEWKSGDILWIIETIGHPQAIRQLLKYCRDALPDGHDAKVRITSRDGKTAVAKLGDLLIDEPAQKPGT